MFKALSAAALASATMIVPAHAAVVFQSTFENVPGGPSAGQFVFVQEADGWTAGGPNNPIELQNNVAGAPAPDGGSVFVELDSSRNSSMSRIIQAGTYQLSFLYSPRPGVGAGSNGIEVYLGSDLLDPPGTVTGAGGGGTSWATVTSGIFTVNQATTLTFAAAGTSESLGGYVDNITLTAVPEPASWAMMIAGFGMVGGAMRRRTVRASVRFA
ncbi:hypothetical protein ACFB49_00770 [Sphingomonas sp. DBB INV C78]|uniref:PEPxxWA-CTERM sorting domain-containing protein n=1 Tax=Sphingomonas sp. DBB INV C78 TaxID=3349434 RepID=UPI0036D2CBE7